MSEPFIAEIRIISFNFAPRMWASCDGQFLPIAQNQALFSLLGTTYGGDGRTTFALPDLRGRIPMHQGQGYSLGQRSGAESVALAQSEMPSHTHPYGGSGAPGVTADPTDGVFAAPPSGIPQYAASPSGAMAPTGNAGGSQPHSNLPPFLVVYYIIALQGVFPPRS